MPEEGAKLPKDQIDRIGTWIDLGAPYLEPLVDEKSVAKHWNKKVSEESRRFWSLMPLQVASPPEVADGDWVETPIDRFVLGAMESRGLRPNPPADFQTLVRRAYLDLLGMPPQRFIFADNWYVPVEEHLDRAEVERRLRATGFGDLRKITGGRLTDLDAAVDAGDSEAVCMWGEGEHRYLVAKA